MTDKKNSKYQLLHEWLDILGKLFPAILVAVIGFLGYYLQDRMSATTLISQREAAESTLRASMFQHLLDTILKEREAGGKGDPEHERLIVELLALNFGEHFEFKPLLEHVDLALAQQKIPQREIDASRRSLKSIARRVIQRQIAMIQNQGYDHDLAHIATVTVSKEACVEKNCHDYTPIQSSHKISHGEPLCLVSPDRRDLMVLQQQFDRSDWREEAFEFTINIMSVQGKGKETIPGAERSGFNCLSTAMLEESPLARSDVEFKINWFNFPLSDNTLLANGNRFAIALEAVDAQEEIVRFKVVWFPKVYFSPRERPINHALIRKKLGFE